MIYILIVMMVSAIATNNGLDLLIGAQQSANSGETEALPFDNCSEDSRKLIAPGIIYCVEAKWGLSNKQDLDLQLAPDCCAMYEFVHLTTPVMKRECKILRDTDRAEKETLKECAKYGHHLNIDFCARLSAGRQFSRFCSKFMAISGADSRRPSTAISVLLAPIVVSIAVSFSDFCPHFH